MTETVNYLACWIKVAVELFSQALAGEPTLAESLPKPLGAGAFGFAAVMEGDEAGRLSVMLDGGLAEASLIGEGSGQRAAWGELLREVGDAAAGELLAKTGKKCRITSFTEIDGEKKLTRAFQLKAGDRSWPILVFDEVRSAKSEATAAKTPSAASGTATGVKAPVTGSGSGTGTGAAAARPFSSPSTAGSTSHSAQPAGLSAGIELLLDVELEASLRFGSREMPLGEIMDLGPGDVVQLDRHISDPVDLIVGDKIVARGEVVLINGNFGLKVTEVAEPQRRLESIRCLF